MAPTRERVYATKPEILKRIVIVLEPISIIEWFSLQLTPDFSFTLRRSNPFRLEMEWLSNGRAPA